MTSTTARPAELTGRIVRAGDADYPVANAGYNLLFTHDPRVIVFAQQAQDVVNALAWARRNDVAVRVRSGRHNLEGWSNVDDGIVIDVSELKSATVKTASHTATVGAGLNQLEAVTELGKAGFAAPTGTEGTVGLVGATLGGGFGLLTRNFGMASDNLIAAEVVVASNVDGAEAITVDEENNADLLWALRGAGNGNFGIVTSLTYKIHPLTQTIYVTATWPRLDDLPEVFDAWQRTAPQFCPSAVPLSRRHARAGPTPTRDFRYRPPRRLRTGSSSRSSSPTRSPPERSGWYASTCRRRPRRRATTSPMPSAVLSRTVNPPAARRSPTATPSSTPNQARAGAFVAGHRPRPIH
jgi:hypothetical protein